MGVREGFEPLRSPDALVMHVAHASACSHVHERERRTAYHVLAKINIAMCCFSLLPCC